MPADKVIKRSYLFYELARAVLFILYRVCFDFKFYGVDSLPNDSRGVIFAPNHASYLDPPAIAIAVKKQIHFLAKEYLFKAFGFKRVLYWLGVLPIKSESDDFRTMRQILRVLKEGESLVIFPEGTRSVDGRFQEVEGGVGFLAVKSKAHVVPVYIQGSFDAFPKGAKCFRFRRVRLYFGKPFNPSDDAELMGQENLYVAVSQKIMAEIKKIKEVVDEGSIKV